RPAPAAQRELEGRLRSREATLRRDGGDASAGQRTGGHGAADHEKLTSSELTARHSDSLTPRWKTMGAEGVATSPRRFDPEGRPRLWPRLSRRGHSTASPPPTVLQHGALTHVRHTMHFGFRVSRRSLLTSAHHSFAHLGRTAFPASELAPFCNM